MVRKATKLTIILGLLVLACSITQAHNLFVEPQALEELPVAAPAEDDFSFETPFLIDNVIDSQAIFSYLTPGDVDVFEFVIAPADLSTGPVLVSASALPPACLETQNNYPVTALVGPGLPPPPVDLDLPFQVPCGMGVVVANNPVVREGARPIFDLDTAEPDLNLGIGWFLPLGLTQDCLLNNPFLCDFSNTIAQPVFAPGTYRIVMYDPNGKEQDYTANIGFSEENFTPNPEVEDLARDNGLLHTRCREPLSESFGLAVSRAPDRSNSVPLDEQILSGKAYIFLTPIFPETDIKKVFFFIDGYRIKTEKKAPYDLRGTVRSKMAAPLRTHRFSNGRHTVRAVIKLKSGGKLSISSKFWIVNER